MLSVLLFPFSYTFLKMPWEHQLNSFLENVLLPWKSQCDSRKANNSHPLYGDEGLGSTTDMRGSSVSVDLAKGTS